MILFPNAKINLGLNVIDKRSDGFHDIETVFYPIDLCDALEIVPSLDGHFAFTSSGLKIPGEQASNLCIKACNLLLPEIIKHHCCEKSETSLYASHDPVPAIFIHLHKVIPLGAGLGGGSSDGTHTLRLLNDLFNLCLTDSQMLDYARQLGSDCAFFIRNSPVFATERGDVFNSIEVDLSGYTILLVIPYIHINTAEAYTMIRPFKPPQSIPMIIRQPVESWKEALINDFELPVTGKYPIIGEIKQKLYELGALYAAMSGSGSALFSIFNHDPGKITCFPGCFVWKTIASKVSGC